MLQPGDKIPAFSLPDQSGEEKTFEDLKRERGMVLYFYPKDSTPGCTVEAKEFTDHLAAFHEKGYEVVGASRDSVRSHCNFTEKQGLEIPLLSDKERILIEGMGAWGEKNRAGKTSMGIFRTTFVIDADGVVQRVYENVKAKGHAEAVLSNL